MKIYQMHKNMDRRRERHVISVKVSELKKAAGGEDTVILTDEAISSFKRDNYFKNRPQELVRLALRHIDDYCPELEDPVNDQEFMMAEKLVLLTELAIRIAGSSRSRKTYEWVTDFVTEQLTGR